MPRQRRRSWVKLWTTGWLHGSIRWQLTPEERGVWADLLALAGECGQEGVIADNDGSSLPRKFIANQLNIPQTLLDRVIAKCKREGRITETNNEVIALANWAHYQSEYDRQKSSRQKKSFAEATLEGEEVHFKETSPDTYEMIDGDTEIKVTGQHPDGSLILDIQPR